MEPSGLPEVDRLLHDLEPDRPHSDRLHAARGLAEVLASDPGIVRALLRARTEDPSPEVRNAAAISLQAQPHQRVLRQHPELTREAGGRRTRS